MATPSGLVSEQRIISSQTVAYTNVGMLALVLYDHVVHIDDEVMYIWSTKLSVGTGFYALSRYLGVLYAFVAVYQIIGVSDKQWIHVKALLFLFTTETSLGT